MFKLTILTVLFVPSILAALSSENMASTLIAAADTGTLEDTFKKYEKEQDVNELSWALVDVAKQGHHTIVATCLRMAHDPFPEDKMRVNSLVHRTLFEVFRNADAESFANIIACFKSSDVKPLASSRICILWRRDVMNVLKRVMKKSPKLITDDLPSWLASHGFDPINILVKPAHEEAFRYLISFATQSVLEETLCIVKRNEHYKVESYVICCRNKSHFLQDLADRMNDILGVVKARNTRIREVLTFLPKVLVDLLLDYAHVEVSDRPGPGPKTTAPDKCLIS